MALGYFNDPERASETFREDGWLFSGDRATIDEQGYVKLIGRKKEIVNRGGLKISVREVEEMLLAHGAFSMVALVAVPDPRLGEKGCLFVVPRPVGIPDDRQRQDPEVPAARRIPCRQTRGCDRSPVRRPQVPETGDATC
ncbi:AMP-binding enzyme [Mameliella alba]|uniref:AMP-binding enzyme n=1 Tax=Mameliella alba TaxID=561184 RepID=UPI001431169B